MLSHMRGFPFLRQKIHVHDRIFSVRLSVDGRLDCFPSLAVVNSAAVK